ncbi:MAG: hemin uptake protein HemP [Hydrogenophaga sp.]|uniref:Hemin uptake protein HemP n=1 Tax=Hydrogenophaga crocea TaxID=2716225 RepID=A0A6G8ICU8_9BURK|nr:hemin uptake protein HemP [Hydrogenophaga sp.]QIM50885.1 hemin uptake protein HemP [Hydrogenophaga crocea]
MRIVRICVYTGAVNPNAPPPSTLATPAAAAPAPAPRVPYAELSGGRREVYIEHAGQVYRLSLTAQNKLILTK